MKFCGKCGAPCDDAYKHCPECGAPLSDGETNADLIDHTTDSTNNAEQTDTGNSNHMHENPFITAYTAPEDASADSPSDTNTSENAEGTSSNAATENATSHSDEHASENTYTYSYSDTSSQTDNTTENENAYSYTHSSNEKETTFDNNGYTNNYNTDNNYNTNNNYTGNNAYNANNTYGNTGYNNNFQQNSVITPRNIPLCVILSIVTCGIYGIYWMIKLNDEINALAGEPYATSGGMVFLLSIVTCNIYNLYWMYKMGERTDRINRIQGNSNILYLVIGILGFGIVNYCLMQDAINKQVRGM